MTNQVRLILALPVAFLVAVLAMAVHVDGSAQVEDVTPPSLTALSFSSTTVDTTAAPANLTVNFTVADDLSGAILFDIRFRSPSGNQGTGFNVFFPASQNHAGSLSVFFAQFIEPGTWTVAHVGLRDAVGNDRSISTADLEALGFPTTVTVVSNTDLTPPVLTALSFSSTTVDTTAAPANLTVNFTVTDDLSGAILFDIRFRSPSGNQGTGFNVFFAASQNHAGSLSVFFPQFSEFGVWTVTHVGLRDAPGNDRSIPTADLEALGFPTTVLNTANAMPQLTLLGAANVWIGLKNSDDVGTKFDLLAEVLKNGSPVGSGQLNGVPGGSSGFNNAVSRTINLALSSPVSVGSGDTLSIRLSVRIAVGVAGHRSGTARLWFNDGAANSHFDATIGGTASDYFLLDGVALGTSAGPGPRKTIDVFVDRAVGGNPFKTFGTWSKTF